MRLSKQTLKPPGTGGFFCLTTTYGMRFRKWLTEMASFSIPPKLNIKCPQGTMGAVDFRFEGPPAYDPPFNGFNNGSKFMARLPNSNKYLVYHGWGDVDVQPEDQAVTTGYPLVPDYWYQRAEILDKDYNLLKPAQGDASGERGKNSTKLGV